MEHTPFERLEAAFFNDDLFATFAEMIEDDPMEAKYVIYSILTALGFIGLILLVIALTVLLGAKGLLGGSIILLSLGVFAVWNLVNSRR
jgi:hypothetical protein